MAESSRQPESTRRERIRKGFQNVGKNLQKFNIGRLIDEMERDQELADDLEDLNKELKEEMARKELVREALSRCQREMEDHLDNFLAKQPRATYEEWIQEFHPENIHEGSLFSDVTEVDRRLYVVDSDHRLLWNERVDPERQVAARTSEVPHGDVEEIDLLS